MRRNTDEVWKQGEKFGDKGEESELVMKKGEKLIFFFGGEWW